MRLTHSHYRNANKHAIYLGQLQTVYMGMMRVRLHMRTSSRSARAHDDTSLLSNYPWGRKRKIEHRCERDKNQLLTTSPFAEFLHRQGSRNLQERVPHTVQHPAPPPRYVRNAAPKEDSLPWSLFVYGCGRFERSVFVSTDGPKGTVIESGGPLPSTQLTGMWFAVPLECVGGCRLLKRLELVYFDGWVHKPCSAFYIACVCACPPIVRLRGYWAGYVYL